ncbi:hypothetical protein WB91_17240 [bacteria symbiont BFo1 of Frankliniella occidentalis]|nr:hypothetical protein WB91_17240 [bacteria symbiont BFo1 of Frankliniella occidentalis]
MSAVHNLKIGPLFFAAVFAGDKKAELRWNDRDFRCGDFLNLREWEGEYSGNELLVEVTHILPIEGFIISGGSWVMMSIKPVDADSILCISGNGALAK